MWKKYTFVILLVASVLILQTMASSRENRIRRRQLRVYSDANANNIRRYSSRHYFGRPTRNFGVLQSPQETGTRADWLTFLSNLKDTLSKYSYQQYKQHLDIESIPATPTAEYLQSIGVPVSNTIRNMLDNGSNLVSPLDFQILRAILSNVLEAPVIECDGAKMTVKGSYIKISDFIKDGVYHCGDSTNKVTVLARTKVFIDLNVSPSPLQMQELSIIAPVYEVVVSGSQALINLDGGSPSQSWTEKASDGVAGVAGSSGTNGGRFFGVTDEIIGSLRITANGGRGSDGQPGGSGYNGANGADSSYASFPSCHGGRPALEAFCDRIYNGNAAGFETWCEKDGQRGTDGNSGADGGKGGLGGKAGHVEFLNAANDRPLPILTEDRPGQDGVDGDGGSGGEGGLRGTDTRAMMATAGSILCGWQQISSGRSTERARRGEDGRKGGNTEGQWQPRQTSMVDTKSIVNEYIGYVKTKIVSTLSNDFVQRVQGVIGRDLL